MPLPLIGWAVIGGTLVYLLAKDNEESKTKDPEDQKSIDGEVDVLEVNRDEVRRLRSELRKAQKKLRASSTAKPSSGKK